MLQSHTLQNQRHSSIVNIFLLHTNIAERIKLRPVTENFLHKRNVVSGLVQPVPERLAQTVSADVVYPALSSGFFKVAPDLYTAYGRMPHAVRRILGGTFL